LLRDGKSVDDARDYILAGCNSPSVCGASQDMPGALTNLPLLLEFALNNGVSRLSGEQIGIKTGDPRKFKSYEDVWEAYTKQVEAVLPKIFLMKNMDKKLFAEFAQTPFQSALMRGCIEKGKDICEGGTAPYMTRAISLAGAPNVGDSLAAIKKVVFEDKKFSMSRLIDALDKNFEGEADILHALTQAPKFGNDEDYVDNIVNQVLVHGATQAYMNSGAIPGAVSNVAAAAVTANVPLGSLVGALPDGRKAGLPISEGGISPYQGRNLNGPTATMRSVAKLDHSMITNGSVLNMRFNPDVLKDQPKVKKFATLVRTFCETGGFLIQFNIVDSRTLREAQVHPDKYRDLLVRVATYSAYFVELSKELQDDIISRIEFQDI
jgi:pyruvate-formate lyase